MNYHWATTNEITERLKKIKIGESIEKSGIPLFYKKNEMYIDDQEGHNLIIGSTGSGKTQSFILPMIKLSQMAKESFIVNDPLGELNKLCLDHLEKENYQVITLDFHEAKYGENWNPLSLIYDYYHNNNYDLAVRMLEDFGYYLFYEPTKQNVDPFWINTTIDYFTGLVLYLIESATKEEVNLLSIYNLSNWLKNDNHVKEWISKIEKTSEIYYNIVGTLEAPPETKGSILSVFNQKIKKYISRRNIVNLLSNIDFEIKDFFDKPTALFIKSGNSEYSNNLIPLLITQIIEYAKQIKNKKRINFILDEFDSMIPIKNFSSTIQNCRPLNIKFTITVQSYAHLSYLYSEEDSKILRYCFSNIIYLLSEDIPTLEEFSKYCGTTNVKGINHPLITVEELRTLENFEAIISMVRMMPMKVKLIPDYKLNWEYETIEKELPLRQEKKIKEYQE